MTLEGLPDFEAPAGRGEIQMFAAYEQASTFALLPTGLAVADRPGGGADFHLELTRPRNPALPPAPYGTLDIRLSATYPNDAALATARERDQLARLTHVPCDAGTLGLATVVQVGDTPLELVAPTSLAWNALGYGRLVAWLPFDAALELRALLQSGGAALLATADVRIAGVSPRIDTIAQFDAHALVDVVLAHADDSGAIARSALRDLLRDGGLPVALSRVPDDDELDRYADAMSDWLASDLGAVPATGGDAEAVTLDRSASGTLRWDLADARVAYRWTRLTFPDGAATARHIGELPPDELSHDSYVDPVPTGLAQIDVWANLPSDRLGVAALGATLTLAAKPPARPQDQIETVELDPPLDAGTAMLRFSPGESVHFAFSTYAVLEDEDGIERHDSESAEHDGTRLPLGPDDFPARFVPAEASPELLRLATVHVVCRRTDDPGASAIEFDLEASQPSAMVATATGATGGSLAVEARPLAGGAPIALDRLPLAALRLDLSSFAEFGPHSVEVTASFDAGQRIVAVDLIAQDDADTPQNVSVFALTPATPSRTFSWTAASPFAPGYRYRLHSSDATPEPWSDPQPPFAPLAVRAPTVAEVRG